MGATSVTSLNVYTLESGEGTKAGNSNRLKRESFLKYEH